MMTTKEQIYSAEYGDCNLTVTWRRSSDPKFLACCKQRIDGVEVVIQGSNIHIQSIVHEAHHAVDWLSALGVINGRENQASECGIIVEEIMAALLRMGWTYGPKTTKAVFNTDVDLALNMPQTKNLK